MLPLSLPNKLFKKLDEDKLDEPVVIEQPKGDGNKAELKSTNRLGDLTIPIDIKVR